MGCCLSCRRYRSSSVSTTPFDTIRLVHLNGYIEDFNYPISVSLVTGNRKPPKQLLFTAAQLVLCAAGSMSKPLSPDAQLQPGNIYFVLPISTFQEDFSPLDMASLVKRLTARAKSVGSSHAVPLSPKASGSPSMGQDRRREMSGRGKARSTWKPILETIREISFTRRSDSDLSEMQIITKK